MMHQLLFYLQRRDLVFCTGYCLLVLYCMMLVSPLAALSSIFLPKPQGFYTMHYRRPHQDYQDRCAQPATPAVTLSYQSSRRSDAIAKALFGAQSWNFTGSEVLDRNPQTDFLADNFGLAPDFQGRLFFKPSMKSITFDLFYQLTLSSWCEDLYIELAAPLVHTRWHLGMCETVRDQGMAYLPRCLMGSDATLQPAQSIVDALSGSFLSGDLQIPWYSGRFNPGTKEITRLADISAAIGGTVYRSDLCHLRAAILTIMPTGNSYSPKELFKPIVGNASRWELGGMAEIQLHYDVAPEHHVDGFLVAVATHIFPSMQHRIFDFADYGPFSRYLLLKRMRIEMVNDLFTYPYAGTLTNAINISSRLCKVSCPLQGDLTLQATYRYKHLQWDVGYNLYGRTHESICIVKPSAQCGTSGYAYAPKGTEGTCYRVYSGDPVTQELTPQPLTSAQYATIHSGGLVMLPKPVAAGAGTIPLTWSSNDNNDGIIGQTVAAITAAPTYQQPQTSNPPRFLSAVDLLPASGAAPTTHVQTVFTQIGYRWDTPCIEPTVLIGAAAMFGVYGRYDALSEWSVWTQLNVRF